MRKKRLSFGHVAAPKVWGHKPGDKTFNLNMDPEQVAILAALCPAAVQDDYSYGLRQASARSAPIQLYISYDDKAPYIVVKRGGKREA